MITTNNLTRLDTLKMRTPSLGYEQALEKEFTITGAAVYEEGDTELSCIRTEEYGFIAGNSSVVRKKVNIIIEYFNDEKYDPTEIIKGKFTSGSTKNEKEFIDLIII